MGAFGGQVRGYQKRSLRAAVASYPLAVSGGLAKRTGVAPFAPCTLQPEEPVFSMRTLYGGRSAHILLFMGLVTLAMW